MPAFDFCNVDHKRSPKLSTVTQELTGPVQHRDPLAPLLVVYTTDVHVTLCNKRRLFPGWCRVAEQDSLQTYILECLRLASDCKQLAGHVDSPALREHFQQMAEIWTAFAEEAPGAGSRARSLISELTKSAKATLDE